MKTIGLIGGMSWESSSEYYRIINQLISQKLGGLHSAQCLLYSFDFAEIEKLMISGEWEKISKLVSDIAKRLEQSGADCIMICTNTIHKLAEAIQSGISIPLLHIADATAEQVKLNGLKTVGLLGTRFTMEGDFYSARLERNYGINVIVPDKADRKFIDQVIFGELVLGVFKSESRAEYVRIMEELVVRGAQGIILGCTEIPLLIKQEDINVPIFDTTQIHATAAVEFALS